MTDIWQCPAPSVLSLVHPLNVNQLVASYYGSNYTGWVWLSLMRSLDVEHKASLAWERWFEYAMLWRWLLWKPDSCGAKCCFMFPALAVVTKFSHTLSDSHCSSDCIGKALSQTMSVGRRLSRDEIFYSGNPEIPRPWRENLIKQCSSTVRATPACAVHINHATPSSAVHQAGKRRMHGREELCLRIYPQPVMYY